MKWIYCALLLLGTLSLHAQVISTIAGNGPGEHSGDGGPATAAHLGDLYQVGVAIDQTGAIYIPSNSQNAIRKVDPSGIISTIAGTGILGYSGDGGPATAAQLYHPSGIIIDNSGNIIFADQNGSVLRKIDRSGIISTISAKTSYACTGDGGPISLASFNAISGVSRDKAGNIYVSDQGCNTVRKISLSGIVSTVAGNGTPGFSGDGGNATAAQLNQPFQVGVDDAGNIYIPEGNNHRVRKVSTGGIITTIAGTGAAGYSGDGGSALQATFKGLYSICVDAQGNIYIADGYNHVVRKIDGSGTITTFAGNGTSGYSGDGGAANMAQMTEIHNVSIDQWGNIYIVDYYNSAIRKVDNCITAVIKQQPVALELCNSKSALFTITTDGASTYQWQVNTGNAWTAVSNNSLYSGTTTTTLQITAVGAAINGYQYRCLATNACGSIASLPATLTVNTSVVPLLTIETITDTICKGASVLFTAVPVNGRTDTKFQWMKNGNEVGSNSTTYRDDYLNDKDNIACVLTAVNACSGTTKTQSNAIHIAVKKALQPVIRITASAGTICSGAPVTFSSEIANGGLAPAYTWAKNGVAVGKNEPSYSDKALTSTDIITCTLASSESCVASSAVTSNALSVNVTALITPSVQIQASKPAVCNGQEVTFTSAVVHAGTSLAYEWLINDKLVQTGTGIYTTDALANGDVVRCRILVNAAAECLTSTTAVSTGIDITVFQKPAIIHNRSSVLCMGSTRQLDAGNFVSYVWNDGSTAKTITVKQPGMYSVQVRDNKNCSWNDTVQIKTWLEQPALFLPEDTSLCSYGDLAIMPKPGYKGYLWNDGSNNAVRTVTQPGLYWLDVTDNNNCKGRDSIRVAPKECLTGLYVPAAFTPNKDGKNDILKPQLFGNVLNYRFMVYNRWGQVVFQSTDITKGWDGTFKGMVQDNHAYVWMCSYQLAGASQVLKKGTVVLIR
jgi:gliding motility-associated-like protein